MAPSGAGGCVNRPAIHGVSCSCPSTSALIIWNKNRVCPRRSEALLCPLSTAVRSVLDTRASLAATAAAVTGSPAVVAAAAAASPPAVHVDLLLSDIRVVLVAPKHEANVGAVARACANFECLTLYLVAPRCAVGTGGVGAGEARKVACGDVVLDRLVVTDTLADALADTAGSIGFTRRAGATRVTHASLGHLLAEFPWALPLQPPPAPLPSIALVAPLEHAHPASPSSSSLNLNKSTMEVQQVPEPVSESDSSANQQLPDYQRSVPSSSSTSPGEAGGRRLADTGDSGSGSGAAYQPYATAFVFGREESGLTEAELRLCSHACAIPTGRLQPSMNLSHAVAIVLGEIFSRRCGLLDVASPAEVAQAAADLDAAGSSNGGRGAKLLMLPAAADRHMDRIETDGLSSTASGVVSSADAVMCSTSSHTTVATVMAAAPLARGAETVAQASGIGSRGTLDAGLLPASAQEVDLLVRKVAAVAEAVGISGEEGSGGGGSGGNHGRRRLPVGHLRSVVSRARLNATESRSLHGLASAVLQRLDPYHPLEARKILRKKQQQQQQQRQP